MEDSNVDFMPASFIDAARIYALAHGLPQTNTGARLRAARAGTGMAADEAEALVHAFFIIQGLRLRNQTDLGLGEDRANRIDPNTLNELERRFLKEAFVQARKLQSRLALDYLI